jgi:hypothetical protein
MLFTLAEKLFRIKPKSSCLNGLLCYSACLSEEGEMNETVSGRRDLGPVKPDQRFLTELGNELRQRLTALLEEFEGKYPPVTPGVTSEASRRRAAWCWLHGVTSSTLVRLVRQKLDKR